MKFKKIMSLLLVLTLISSLLTTVTLLNPTAEDTEATTPAETTNYDTHLLHVVGNSSTANGIAPFLIVSADNVKAGETYTVSIVVKGIALNGQAVALLVREGAASSSTTLASTYSTTNPGATTKLYDGAYRWTVQVTPTTKSTLCIGMRLGRDNTKTADFYMGALEVVNSKGINIAPKFTESTSIHYALSLTGLIQEASLDKLSSYVTTLGMESIDDVADADLKQKLFNDFYLGDSMVNFTPGSSTAAHSIYRKIPASKLKPNTTYNFTIRYENTFAFDQYNYPIIREGTSVKTAAALGTNARLSGYVNCYEFSGKYTTDNVENAVYVGFFIPGGNWSSANLYIADMTFTDEEGNNLLPPLSDMEWYIANSASGTIDIRSFTASETTVKVQKQQLDKEKYFEPENLEAAKYVLHAKGQSAPTTPRGITVQVPATRLTEGEEYTVNVTLKSSKALNSTYNVLLVQSGEAKGGMIAHTGASTAEAKGTTTTNYSGAIKWTVKIQPDASKNLYIGMYFNTANLTSVDFYLGNVEVIDSNGNNVAPAFANNTQLYAFASWGGGVVTPSATSENTFFETREFVRIDKVEDETLKQTLFDSFYNGDSMLKLTPDTAYNQHCIYKRIPKDALEGNKKYKLSIKYSGLTISANDFVVIRDVTTAASPIMTSSGKQTTNVDKYTNHSVYTDYYTTPETPTDLYIGFYLRKSAWETTTLYIADMQFVDGDGNNLFTSMANTSDLYAGYNNGAISKFTSSNTLVNLEKQVLDTEKFSEPVSTDRKMINVTCINGANNAKFYVKVPHALPGTYQATYKIKGMDLADGRYFDVRTNTPLATNSSIVKSTTQVATPSLDESTLEFTVTDFSDIYVGFTVPMKHIPNMNYYIEKLEVVRIVDGIPSENLIDENLDIAKFHRHNANNGESEAWTILTINANGYADFNSVFRISVMDYDKNILYPDQIVNIKGGEKVDDANYEYGKQATGLKAGKYRLTLVEQGVDIKTKDNPFFHVSVNGNISLSTYYESAQAKVEMIDGATSSYKLQYDVTIEEDGGIIYGGFKSAPANMPNFNLYLVELSLVEIDEEGNALSENLFSDLNVRDWRMVINDYALVSWDKYKLAANQSINNINLGVADANGNGKVDVADIRIVSKLQDAGVEVTDATNIITIRNTLLGKVS